MAIRKISLMLFIPLWLGLGCSPQSRSDRQDAQVDTVDKNERATRGPVNEFNRTLSHTVLNFRLDDCRSTLHSINRAIDNLNAKTQRNYWESIKQRYAEHKTRYDQVRQDCLEVSGDSSTERVSIQARLAELRLMFQETGESIARRDREYAQARRQYETQKKKYFDDLGTDQANRDSAEGGFYTGAQGSMGVTALDVTAKHVLVTLEAYSNEGRTLAMENLPFPASRGGLSSVEGIEDHVSLVDQHGQSFGPPLEIEYDRLHFLDGIIVTLAYARNPESNERPAKLELKASPLGNRKPITLTLALDQDRNRLVSGLDMEELLGPGQVSATGPVATGTKVIHCRRAGMHLKVPVRLDIHGVEVKCSMLLDTGASLTVLAKSVYNRGLARPLNGLRRIRLKTANGPMTCPVDRLHVSTTAYGRILPVALTNDSMSLLGANYFVGHRITIDLNRECIYVHPGTKQ
jgi:hypothetical protein